MVTIRFRKSGFLQFVLRSFFTPFLLRPLDIVATLRGLSIILGYRRIPDRHLISFPFPVTGVGKGLVSTLFFLAKLSVGRGLTTRTSCTDI